MLEAAKAAGHLPTNRFQVKSPLNPGGAEPDTLLGMKVLKPHAGSRAGRVGFNHNFDQKHGTDIMRPGKHYFGRDNTEPEGF